MASDVQSITQSLESTNSIFVTIIKYKVEPHIFPCAEKCLLEKAFVKNHQNVALGNHFLLWTDHGQKLSMRPIE